MTTDLMQFLGTTISRGRRREEGKGRLRTWGRREWEKGTKKEGYQVRTEREEAAHHIIKQGKQRALPPSYPIVLFLTLTTQTECGLFQLQLFFFFFFLSLSLSHSTPTRSVSQKKTPETEKAHILFASSESKKRTNRTGYDGWKRFVACLLYYMMRCSSLSVLSYLVPLLLFVPFSPIPLVPTS